MTEGNTPEQIEVSLVGKRALDGTLARHLLRAIAWSLADSQATESSIYVYDDEISACQLGLDVRVDRFEHQGYGKGYRLTVRPVVDVSELPGTRLDDAQDINIGGEDAQVSQEAGGDRGDPIHG